MKIRLLTPLVLVVALVAGCGGGGGGSADLQSDDAAVVGDSHIAKSEIDNLMSQLKDALVSKGLIP